MQLEKEITTQKSKKKNMHQSIPYPIKYTEHWNMTKKLTKPHKTISDAWKQIDPSLFMIDLNVMDWSSNKEQEENYFLFHRQCVNRYMNKINIKTSCKNVFVLLILTKSSVHLIKLLLLPLMVVESFVAYANDPSEISR